MAICVCLVKKSVKLVKVWENLDWKMPRIDTSYCFITCKHRIWRLNQSIPNRKEKFRFYFYNLFHSNINVYDRVFLESYLNRIGITYDPKPSSSAYQFLCRRGLTMILGYLMVLVILGSTIRVNGRQLIRNDYIVKFV